MCRLPFTCNSLSLFLSIPIRSLPPSPFSLTHSLSLSLSLSPSCQFLSPSPPPLSPSSISPSSLSLPPLSSSFLSSPSLSHPPYQISRILLSVGYDICFVVALVKTIRVAYIFCSVTPTKKVSAPPKLHPSTIIAISLTICLGIILYHNYMISQSPLHTILT